MKQARTPHPAETSDAGPSLLRGMAVDPTAEQWTARCERRLRELRPGSQPQALRAMAVEMCTSLGYFDPVMAAEMEHEGGMLHD